MKKYAKVTPEGTRDLLFEECNARRIIESRLSALFKSRGYNRIITPAIEYFDVFNRESSGMDPESMYKLIDTHGRMLVLRPDITMPIARVAATRLKGMPVPIRLYYTQKVFRFNPSLSGQNDEVAQGGIELIGAGGIRSDLEIISTAVEALNECSVKDYQIEIGHAGFFNALADSLSTDDETKGQIINLIESKNYAALNDVLDSIKTTQSTKLLKLLPRLFGGEEVLNEAFKMCDSDKARASLSYLRDVFNRLSQLELDAKINIDLGLVHRNSYYTGVVFRGYIEGSGITVLTGGRYDSLMDEFGYPLESTGFAVDVDVLATAMLSRGEVRKSKPADILVFGQDGYEVHALKYISELTQKGFICENSTLSTEEESLNYAKLKGIKRMVTVCGDKIKEKKV